MNGRLLAAALYHFVRETGTAAKTEAEYLHQKRKARAAGICREEHYTEWLREFHQILNPNLYLEIGIQNGKTMTLKLPATRAVGIDPKFVVTHSLQNCSLYKVPSDEFFQTPRSVESVVEGLDLSFIDGLHEYHQVARDIVNCAKHSNPSAPIVVHDVLPPDSKSARPLRSTKLWPGDVYRVLPLLKTCFPNTKVFVVPAAPTGIAIIGNPTGISASPLADSVLSNNGELFGEFDEISLERYRTEWLPKMLWPAKDVNVGSAARQIVAELT